MAFTYKLDTEECRVSFKAEALVVSRFGETGLVWIAAADVLI